MVGVRFGGRGVDFDDSGENVVGALFLFWIDVVEEGVMGVS